MKQHWAIIRFGGSCSAVVLDKDHPDKWYWSGSNSWYSIPGGPEIVKDFGYLSDIDPKIDEIFLEVLRDYNAPEKCAPCQSAGWLSPEGDFYPCSYYQHDGFAASLAAVYYNSLEGTRELEKHRWLRVYDDGHIGLHHLGTDWSITQKQLDALFDMSSSFCRDQKFKQNIDHYLRHLKVK